MAQDTRIADLLSVPSEQIDLNWLITSLQTAVELELSTLPPYLCGYWSVKDSSSPVAQLILSVVYQEMLHMGLAANMLTAIGGQPTIATAVPTYPGGLPGGVRPELTVSLSGLTKEYVQNVYMQIEYPEGGPLGAVAGPPTIGQFYDAILAAFQQLQPSLDGAPQITATIGNSQGFANQLYAVNTLTLVETAISEIKEQGEGTSTSPDAPSFGNELAHYYRFGEIYHGQEFVETNGTWGYTGASIPFPDVWPMAELQAHTWSQPPGDVAQLLQSFDGTYRAILSGLQAAWTGQGSIGTPIGQMFSLQQPAVALMQIPLGDGSGLNYGPDFYLGPPGA